MSRHHVRGSFGRRSSLYLLLTAVWSLGILGSLRRYWVWSNHTPRALPQA